jgi:hypothetical protein
MVRAIQIETFMFLVKTGSRIPREFDPWMLFGWPLFASRWWGWILTTQGCWNYLLLACLRKIEDYYLYRLFGIFGESKTMEIYFLQVGCHGWIIHRFSCYDTRSISSISEIVLSFDVVFEVALESYEVYCRTNRYCWRFTWFFESLLLWYSSLPL